MSKTLVDSQDGTVYFRTKTMTRKATAYAFAKMLSANSKRFSVAIAVKSERTKEDSWFVKFLPKSESRRVDLYYREFLKRQESAKNEGPQYKWNPANRPNGKRFYFCVSLTGKTYQVDKLSCT